MPHGAFHPDRAAHQLHQSRGDGETQPGAPKPTSRGAIRLRERLEDLLLLVRHILDREGFAGLTVSEVVMDAFRQYSWPGNIRELRNVLVRAAAVSVTATIVAENLPAEVRSGFSAHRNGSGSSPDRIRVEQALAEAFGNISRAAQILGIHRTTLHHKIREYGLARERFMSSRAPS